MFDFFKKKKNDEEENSKKNLSDENNLEKSEENEKIQESGLEETIEENFQNENFKQLQNDDTEEELGFFTKLSKGLSKTREQFSSKLKNLFTANVKIDDDLYDEL
ncbi:MAG: signal recognition particle-docking protein FtsY, partial [Anaerococcus vaginalis]|nr:signal recognition particle-docking protein FtsY [Anaerococcus vaginalis]